MFCQIQYLTGHSPKTRIVSRHYQSAACMTDMEEFASAECRTRHAEGFRLTDMHTGIVTEVWD